MEYGESTECFVGQNVPLKIRPQVPGILIQSEEGVTQSNIIKNFIAFDFDIIYVKGKTIPHVDKLSRLRLQSENGE